MSKVKLNHLHWAALLIIASREGEISVYVRQGRDLAAVFYSDGSACPNPFFLYSDKNMPDIYVHGDFSLEVGGVSLNSADYRPKITMTKTPPKKGGSYYYAADSSGSEVELVDVVRCSQSGRLCVDRDERGLYEIDIHFEGCYWAEVDYSMFEFEG